MLSTVQPVVTRSRRFEYTGRAYNVVSFKQSSVSSFAGTRFYDRTRKRCSPKVTLPVTQWRAVFMEDKEE